MVQQLIVAILHTGRRLIELNEETTCQQRGRGSTKALRALNARWALPAYPVFEDEKSNGSDDNPVKRKIA